MTRKLVALLAAMALLLTVGLAPAYAAELVPLKAKAAGSFVFNADNTRLELTGAGNASFLGAVTSRGTITFTGSSTCADGFAVSDRQTLTSTDTGETITTAVVGEVCPTATPGVYRIVGPFMVTGGTGHFAGASGAGFALCFGDFTTNTYDFTLQGNISRPGSR